MWKVRNRIDFDNKAFSLETMKMDFVCFLWAKSKLLVTSIFNRFFFNGWVLLELLMFFCVRVLVVRKV